MSGMNPQPAHRKSQRSTRARGQIYSLVRKRAGWLALYPATCCQKAKLPAPPFPSLHIPNPRGVTVSTAADAERRAIAHPINLTEWEKQQTAGEVRKDVAAPAGMAYRIISWIQHQRFWHWYRLLAGRQSLISFQPQRCPQDVTITLDHKPEVLFTHPHCMVCSPQIPGQQGKPPAQLNLSWNSDPASRPHWLGGTSQRHMLQAQTCHTSPCTRLLAAPTACMELSPGIRALSNLTCL